MSDDIFRRLSGDTPAVAQPPARRMSDLLLIPALERQTVQWLISQGEARLADVAAQLKRPEDETAALLDRLAKDGFVQTVDEDGEVRYRARLVSRTGSQLSRNVWQALYDKLGDLFHAEGAKIALRGNQPVFLDDPDQVWLVQSGEAHLFTVGLAGDRPSGKRAHLVSLGPGSLLFGMERLSDAEGLALLATGSPGTILVRLELSRLKQLAAVARFADQIDAMVEDWVNTMADAAFPGNAPREARLVESGPEARLDAGVSFRAKMGLLWLAVKEGRALVYGREELPLRARDGYFPVARRCWLRSHSALAFVGLDTKGCLAKGELWRGLESFHRLVLQAALLARKEGEAGRADRIAAKSGADERTMQGAVSRLAGVLNREERAALPVDEGDVLLAACREVGRSQGIEIQAPPRGDRATDAAGRLARIALASRVRYRLITLEKDWWRRDGGPLLGVIAADHRPVALIPASASSYRLIDPAKAGSVPVTEAVAATLADHAYMLYRPFPDRALGINDLARFAMRGTIGDLFTIILMGVLSSALALVTPLVTQTIFERVIPGAELDQLTQMVLALFIAAASTAAFLFVRSIAVLRVTGKANVAVQAALWDRLLNLPTGFFRQYSAGDLTQRAMGMFSILQVVTGVTISSVLAGVFSVSSWAILFKYDSTMALLATALGLLQMAAIAIVGMLSVRYAAQAARVQGKLSGTILQLLSGITKLRVAGAEGRAFSLWAKGFSEQKACAFKGRSAGNALGTFQALFSAASLVVIFGAAGMPDRPIIATGAFLAYFAAFNQFLAAMGQMSGALLSVIQVAPVYQRMKPILQTLPEVDVAKAHPGELSGGIEISHLTFRYDPNGPPTLEDVTLAVKPGQFAAVVGPSGSGKSTLLRLMLGFEKPESGSIYFDGQDMALLDLRAVRRQIGVVLQNGRLTPGSVYDNIAGGTPITIDEAWEAARMAGMADDIQQMPMGMQTLVSEGGSTFSGGQRQRLMIARALATRPRILLFDEATSALDNVTQSIVSESLDRLKATRIVIAHRLSTIINADVIYVVDRGRLVQTGSYETLVNQPGTFAEIVRRQMA